MDRLQMLVRMTYAVGVLTLIGMAFSTLALSDIVHGESDPDLEWATLRLTALLMLMFIGLSFAALRRVSRELQQK